MKKSRLTSPTSAFASQLTPNQYDKLLTLLAKELDGALAHLTGIALKYLSFCWIIDLGACYDSSRYA